VPARISEPLGRSNTGTLSTTTGVSEMGTGVGGCVGTGICARANGVAQITSTTAQVQRHSILAPADSDPDPRGRRALRAPLAHSSDRVSPHRPADRSRALHGRIRC